MNRIIGEGGDGLHSDSYSFCSGTSVRPGAGCSGCVFCLGGDERTSERRRSFHGRKPGWSGVVSIFGTDVSRWTGVRQEENDRKMK